MSLVVGKKIAAKVARIALGIVFLALSIPGMFLPFLQGILFLFIGLSLLAHDVPLIRRMGERLRRRYPRQAERLRRGRERMAKKVRDFFRLWSRS